MGIIEVGVLAALAAICAALGQFISGYSRGGCPVSFVVAFFGTVVGPGIFRNFGWPEPLVVPIGPMELNLVSSTAGALLLVIVVNLITHHRKF
jgi:uncharacterized membrane protein YeaQ/YmgE (transglycosylase-associated protein family)